MDAGWYMDPDDPMVGRYHDGSAWTDETVSIPDGKTLPAAPAPDEPERSRSESQESPNFARRRALAFAGVVVLAVGLIVAVVALRHGSDSTPPSRVEGAAQTRGSTQASPLTSQISAASGGSAACRQAFLQQVSVQASQGVAPASISVCSQGDWIATYRQLADALGADHANPAMALEAACAPFRAAAKTASACEGIAASGGGG